jgi:hypothetical protein
MYWFPFEREQIESSFSLEVLENILKDKIEKYPPVFSCFYSGPKLFKGQLKSNYFKISRIIKHQNSFLPVLEGNLIQSTTGSKILIKYRLNYFVLVFWILWMIFIFLGFLVFLLGTIVSNAGFFFLIPLFMLAFGYFLCVILFSCEVTKAKKILRDIFGA